jgi:beta-lactam-binding protein with PASTA domain
MADIFLSYASADRDRAQRLAAVLESQGWSVWWDRTIPPGSTFDEVIERALESARCVVVLWSRTSVTSDWVKTEAADGARRKILVPVIIERARIPLEFRRVQAADLSNWQGEPEHPELATLFRSITDRLAQASAPGAAISPPSVGLEESPAPATRFPSGGAEPGARKKRLGFLAAFVVLLLAAGGAAALLWRPQVPSPDVVGIPAERARSVLKTLGLEVGKEESKETEGSPAGTVVAQNPPAGQRLRKGGAVDLVVAIAPRVSVPDVRGQPLERASPTLKASGLTIGVTSAKVTEEAKPGIVLLQRPEAGARVDKGTAVDLQVAAREMVEVPNVVGETLARVNDLLTRAGLGIGRRDAKATDEVKPGVVLSQSPAAGEQVAKGQEVNLVIAARPTVRVPDVMGLAVRDAQARLEGAGLATGTVDRVQIGDRAPGTVIRQRPAAGESIQKGRAVDLTIASAPPTEPPRPPDSPPPTGTLVTVPDVVKMPVRDAMAAIERVGLVGMLRDLETDRAPAGTVLTQRPRAGSELGKGKNVDLTAAVAAAGPDAAGNEIKGFTWRDVSRTEIQLKLIYTYKGSHGDSGVTIVAYPLDATGRVPPDFERTEPLPVSVGTRTIEIRIARKPDTAAITSSRIRVCMGSRERRATILCRTYTFAKTWG